MKHFMLPKKAILREENQAESANSTSIKSNSTPKKAKASKENADPNSVSPSPAKMKSPLPPRPPPLKCRKLNADSAASDLGVLRAASDSGVQVIVRMRPPNKTDEEGDMVVEKVSNDTLTIGAHTFTFDSIADTGASQADIFQLVGAPLVENCLAGFNSSVFAYGQTGSGKTYTVWGPANALLEENISSEQHGLTPRVFQRLFKRVDEEQIKHSDKQLVYQCRCSFLEIYNEQITDLLDPTQKALQIREDVKAGVYVENLTEEYVSSTKDVMQLLIKGLTNRRTGATSVNAESSRSHSVFTCVVESKCKSLEDGLSYFKTSRINLVDLAGSERQKLTGAAGERLKEAGNINRSLSQLGNLINILAEVSQTGKQRHIPYRDSKLTFLLQESLGGNAKLAMMCAISPVQSCKSETFSTLRFAQRAKAIKNKAIVNEETKDDVNVLKEVIRQLKDELLRMKSNGNQMDQNDFSSRWNARRSLNLLKFSLNRPLTESHLNDVSDEDMEIVEEAEGVVQQAELRVAEEETIPQRQDSLDTDVTMEEVSKEDNNDESVIAQHDECQNISKTDGSDLHISINDLVSSNEKPGNDSCRPSIGKREEPEEILVDVSTKEIADSRCLPPHDIDILTSDISPVLKKSPIPTVSPRALNSSRKCFKSSPLATTQRSISDATTPVPNLKPSNSICLGSTLSERSKISSAPTAYLAASLHRGLEIIGSNRRSAALRSFRFSCNHSDITARVPVPRVDAAVQTASEDFEVSDNELRMYVCCKCKTTGLQDEMKDTNPSPNMQLVPISGPESRSMNHHVPKAVEKVLAGAIRREMALEELCAQQNAEIMQLNRLVQQYKHERECNAVISETREDKIARLESLMDGVLGSEDFMDEELSALTYEHKLLKENYKHHPDVLRINIELKRVQDELERYKNFCDMGEREVLVDEIHDLRSQLQSYTDSSLTSSKRWKPQMLQLTYSLEPKGEAPHMSMVSESVEDIVETRHEEEDDKWIEAESEWITLVEELRLELESTRALIQNQKQELHMEKTCADELKEAMQLAMEGQARMIEQYSELQEKHIHLLMRHRKVQDGIEDVKKAAAKAGVRGTGLKFINVLAAEVSSLKVEREKERRHFRDENKALQAQLRDTAEAVQAAGELLVRLKEAEEAIAAAEKRAIESEQETDRAYRHIDSLKKNHEKEISALNKLIVDSQHPKDAVPPVFDDDSGRVSYDADEIYSADDQRWREEFKPFYNAEEEELSSLVEPSSWFSGYDRCNV